MNGYETMSENYKILMQRGEIEKEAAEKAIRVYDFLVLCVELKHLACSKEDKKAHTDSNTAHKDD